MSISSQIPLCVKQKCQHIINHFRSHNPNYHLQTKTDKPEETHGDHTIYNTPAASGLTIGQIGLDSQMEFLWLLHCINQLESRITFHCHLFIHDTEDLELLNRWALDMSGQFSGYPIENLINAIQTTPVLAISGCQRIELASNKLIIDLYVGDLHHNLTQFPQTTKLIQQWCYPLQKKHPLITESTLWQMGRISDDQAILWLSDVKDHQQVKQLKNNAALTGLPIGLWQETSFLSADRRGQDTTEVCLRERRALRHQFTEQHQCFPLATDSSSPPTTRVAIIGGGIASAHLALSLAMRSRDITLFCQDKELASAASGNPQGALYPLLTPENRDLCQFSMQAFVFSRRRLHTLSSEGYSVEHEFCGVLQTPYDQRSHQRLENILKHQYWPDELAHRVSVQQATSLAGIDINQGGIFYPLGGWVNPVDYTLAAINKAESMAHIDIKYEHHIDSITQENNQWYLHQQQNTYGPFNQLILANGAQLTQFSQTEDLPLSKFRGQVSQVPSRNQLQSLATVLCSKGYMAPQNQAFHTMGASYVKNAKHLDYCPLEQLDNLHKITQSYPGASWLTDIDMSGHNGRVAERMVMRDHFPMFGCAPDVQGFTGLRQSSTRKHAPALWQKKKAPIFDGLYILGGFGSRGICHAPLAAEILAAQLCHDFLPINHDLLPLVNPNRIWMRKLLKGKPLF